jgi:hypothetical protein
MDAPVTQPPSIKAPRSLVIIHTVFLEIGLVILASVAGKEILSLDFNPGGWLAIVFIVLWILAWLLTRTRLADIALRVSICVALGLLPISAPIWIVGTAFRLIYDSYREAHLITILGLLGR